jgi:hypothetical protein
MLLVGSWTMFGDGYSVPMTTRTQMRSHALALMEKLDCGGRRANFYQLLYEVVRHAVVVGVERNVVVDVDPCAGPLAEIEPLGRQSAGRGFSAGLSSAANCDAREPVVCGKVAG